MISRIRNRTGLPECVTLIRAAFQTVAETFRLTPENCPTHAAFITEETLRRSFDAGVEMYLLRDQGRPEGFVAIERSPKEVGTYYVEKLAVHPNFRHRGYGRALMEFAVRRVQDLGGRRVSVAMIDENTRVRAWYAGQGFVTTGVKVFPRLPFRVCFMELSVTPGER